MRQEMMDDQKCCVWLLKAIMFVQYWIQVSFGLHQWAQVLWRHLNILLIKVDHIISKAYSAISGVDEFYAQVIFGALTIVAFNCFSLSLCPPQIKQILVDGTCKTFHTNQFEISKCSALHSYHKPSGSNGRSEYGCGEHMICGL